MDDNKKQPTPKRWKDAEPLAIKDQESGIRSDEDYRIWSRTDGTEVIIRSRKTYLINHLLWIFEIGADALSSMIQNDGLSIGQVGIKNFIERVSGHDLIKFIDSRFTRLNE